MENEQKNNLISAVATLVVAAVVMVGMARAATSIKNQNLKIGGAHPVIENGRVLKDGEAVLPVTLGNIGAQMVRDGVIDKQKFLALYQNDPELYKEAEGLLTENQSGNVIITPKNAPLYLNFFWALGLSNKNEILERGEMMDPLYGGAENFASTGGWTIGMGSAMDHYSRHKYMMLDSDEQNTVDQDSRNIYRPCCKNSAHFPDCNHGMAMLGFLELGASQGVNEKDLYEAGQTLNSFWFPGYQQGGGCSVK